MKTCKRMIALMLVVVMMMAMLAVPASAATILTVNWKGEISTFPARNRDTDTDDADGYVEMLQRFLRTYSHTSKAMIDVGGVDGSFGPGTEKVVIAFQVYKNLSADGRVGPMTWSKISTCLTQSDAYINCLSPASSLDRRVILLRQNNSTVYMHTYDNFNNDITPSFHSVS